MNKEFVPYELAVKLKVLGFDEPCFGYFDCERDFQFIPNKQKFLVCEVTRPTFSQTFRWFREKYETYYTIEGSKRFGFQYFIYDEKESYEIKSEETFKTYEEAEIVCLDKLIEIVESKSE